MAELDISTSFVFDVDAELMTLVSSLIVKREDLANTYETATSSQAWDMYLGAMKNNDTFDAYETYSYDILISAGLTMAEAIAGALDKDDIPLEKRDTVVLKQRAAVIAAFEESNNYYRMLNGLPDYDDISQYVYIYETSSGVDITKPVHMMTDDEITILNTLGKIDELLVKYPKYRYLSFLGSKKIATITARSSKKFDILRYGYINNTMLRRRFNVNYEISKNYILNNFYKRRFSIDNTYFDAYMGLLILTNALIITVNSSVDIFNSREITNEQTIKGILSSYNLDVFDNVPATYRKKIADNISTLIISKGSDEVINKIFKICGFENITVRKFMLVKEHLKDAVTGEYKFAFENDGVTPKYTDMYDIHFSQVDITNSNIINELQKDANKLAYVDVVSNDIFWGAYESDEAIRQTLIKENFNYIDTDYININTAYSISKLTMEISYFFSMVLDNKAYLEKLLFIEPLYGYTISIFYAIVMLAALLSKKIGWNGDIVTDPTLIASVYKYNFSRGVTEITNILTKYGANNSYVSSELATILPTGKMNTTAELVNLYFNNEAILTKLKDLKVRVKKLNEYLAIKEIFDYVMTGKTLSTVFTKTNGTVATNYLDFLADTNPVISTYIDTLPRSDIDAVINKILSSLEDFVDTTNFKYLFVKIPSFSSENILKTYLLQIINIFKAFNINIYSMSITYDIDTTMNNIKIMDSYSYVGNVGLHNNIPVMDTMGITTNYKQTDKIKIRDEISYMDKNNKFYYI